MTFQRFSSLSCRRARPRRNRSHAHQTLLRLAQTNAHADPTVGTCKARSEPGEIGTLRRDDTLNDGEGERVRLVGREEEGEVRLEVGEERRRLAFSIRQRKTVKQTRLVSERRRESECDGANAPDALYGGATSCSTPAPSGRMTFIATLRTAYAESGLPVETPMLDWPCWPGSVLGGREDGRPGVSGCWTDGGRLGSGRSLERTRWWVSKSSNGGEPVHESGLYHFGRRRF